MANNAAPQSVPIFVLPPRVQAELDTHCKFSGEDPNDFVADAVTLLLDEFGHHFSEETVGVILEMLEARPS